MARMQNKLTARFVATAPIGRHSDGNGLYLVVTSTQRSWTFLYIRNGRRREMGLGPVATTGLAAARTKADEARRLLAAGIDPLDARKEEGREDKTATFGEMADRYIAAMEGSWKNEKHRNQWKMTLSRVRDDDGNLIRSGYCLSIIDLAVDEVNTDHVLAILAPIWIEKQETASRLRSRIEAVLDAAKAAGLRDGSNAATWRGHLALLLPKRKKLQRGHHAAMQYADVPAFMESLRAAKGIGARALEFAILTAARSGEVRGAQWGEIDVENKLWVVPPSRMKAGRIHRVPLTERAVEILTEMMFLRRPVDGDNGLVFPSTKAGRPLSDMTLTAVMRRLGEGKYTAHGFRSAFRDWAGDETDAAREVAEAALAHRSGDKVEAAYRRADALEKRRALMKQWGEYLSGEGGKNKRTGKG